jgi:thioredoxin reductase
MPKMPEIKTELAIIGAGPAGLAAAVEAAKAGVETTIVDENIKAGGQLFKQIHKFFGSHRHHAGVRGYRIGEALLDEIRELDVNVLLNTVAFGFYDDKIIGLFGNGETTALKADSVIIATGAIENAIEFEGWTLPGVMGAGAVQTMINVNGVLPGDKVMMVGTGNVGLIVSYQLLQAGAELVALVEAKPRISGYHVHAAKIKRLGVPFFFSHSVVQAGGKEGVEYARIAEIDDDFNVIKGSTKQFEVDLICIAVGLRPLDELARLARCKIEYVTELGGFLPVHNQEMMSSESGVYVAGDITGIEEASTAMEEGKMAGLSAAFQLGKLSLNSYSERKRDILLRMSELRQGSYGEDKRKCKEEVFNRYEKL